MAETHRVRSFDLTRAIIAERLGQARPDLALDLMWRFMTLAEPVINRVDDSNGSVGDVFRNAREDLGALAARARPDPQALAERVFAAVTKNDYGEFDQPVPAIFPAWARSVSRHSGRGCLSPYRTAQPRTASTATLPPPGGRCRIWLTAKEMSMRSWRWCPARTGSTRLLPPE